MAIEFVDRSIPRAVPEDTALCLYRIAQEAIVNARKHAEARTIAVSVADAGDGVAVRITDDGVGFNVAEGLEPRAGHMGLSTMVERAELLGGWCRITSSAGTGTAVECWLPTDVAEQGRTDRTA